MVSTACGGTTERIAWRMLRKALRAGCGTRARYSATFFGARPSLAEERGLRDFGFFMRGEYISGGHGTGYDCAVHFQMGAKRRQPEAGKRSTLPELHDGGIVEVFLGGAFDGAIDFAGGGSGGRGDTKLIGKGERKAEGLVPEAERENGEGRPFLGIGRFVRTKAGTGPAGRH